MIITKRWMLPKCFQQIRTKRRELSHLSTGKKVTLMDWRTELFTVLPLCKSLKLSECRSPGPWSKQKRCNNLTCSQLASPNKKWMRTAALLLSMDSSGEMSNTTHIDWELWEVRIASFSTQTGIPIATEVKLQTISQSEQRRLQEKKLNRLSGPLWTI